MKKSSMLSPNAEIVEASGVDVLLTQIRPEWKEKRLIRRVNLLLPVDPSSACQRLFNAAIHDLKQKINVAGLDIAREAANKYKLPPISKAEDIEDYSVMTTINLAYRMGLLIRPGWRRLLRAYDIRKDLEHEDDEYEAGIEDCVYIFKTCVDVVLSKDPIQLLKLTDIKQVVEEPKPTTLTDGVIEDFQHAPEPRQHEIYKFLIGSALDDNRPDVMRQNCYNTLCTLSSVVEVNVLVLTAKEMVERIKRRVPDKAEIRVALAAGILPYLKQTQLKDFYREYFELMKNKSFDWRSCQHHGELLRNLEELGGLDYCPDKILNEYVEWLVLCYIGEPGGYGIGRHRKVFYSNVGAPIALDILQNTERGIEEVLINLPKSSRQVNAACQNEYVARRFENILDWINQ